MTLIIGIAHRIQRKRKRHETKAVTLKEILVGGKKKLLATISWPFLFRGGERQKNTLCMVWSGLV